MRLTIARALTGVLALGGCADGDGQSLPQDGQSTSETGETATAQAAQVDLVGTDGQSVGSVTLRQTPRNGVLLGIQIDQLPPGPHAIHIHETGQCDPPGFDGAGGHYAPEGNAHGLLHPDGKHAGDLLNLDVPDGGQVQTERLAQEVTLQEGATGSLFDGDGSAIVIHTSPDDYQSQPAGGGGTKIACGVVRR